LQTGIGIEQQHEYAVSVLGGRYENGKYYDAAGAEVKNVTNEVIANELAKVRALDDVEKAMLDFADNIQGYRFKNLYTKQ
jgi:hypothetical protein